MSVSLAIVTFAVVLLIYATLAVIFDSNRRLILICCSRVKIRGTLRYSELVEKKSLIMLVELVKIVDSRFPHFRLVFPLTQILAMLNLANIFLSLSAMVVTFRHNTCA
jgi:hypothetical protein